MRTLTTRDVRDYLSLRREMLSDAPWAFMASPGNDHGSRAAFLRRILGRPAGENTIVGAFAGGRLVASAGLLREETPKRRHIAIVWGVYVTPAARGRGLGKAVLVAAIETARRWSRSGERIVAVELSVSERARAARRLYASLGFRAWGVEPDALRVKNRLYREIHMSLPLRNTGRP